MANKVIGIEAEWAIKKDLAKEQKKGMDNDDTLAIKEKKELRKNLEEINSCEDCWRECILYYY